MAVVVIVIVVVMVVVVVVEGYDDRSSALRMLFDQGRKC